MLQIDISLFVSQTAKLVKSFKSSMWVGVLSIENFLKIFKLFDFYTSSNIHTINYLSKPLDTNYLYHRYICIISIYILF